LRKLDKYILKKYLTSFIFTLLILIPVAIAIDVSEKIGKFLANPDLTTVEIIKDYYIPFVLSYVFNFMALPLFIAVILFTSKLSNDTEIVAIHSAGISFKRFLKPYIIGATIVASVANFDLKNNRGYNFSYEEFEGLKLKHKIIAGTIKYESKDSTYALQNYKKRYVGAKGDSIITGRKLDTTFNFFPKDLLYVAYLARAMTSPDLSDHIELSANRGVKNLNQYKVELYKRTSLPVSSFILTLIAVALASKKRRGGVGINLAFGIALMFVYVFFMKVAEVLGAGATSNPLFMVWLPNILFGGLAIYLYLNAKR